ncbi:MAG: right-handed parallel beta-helix repeat-containing protein, partial [Acidobacteriota bacterium]
MRNVPCILLQAAFSVLAAMPTAAAPITWADPAGLCAGNLPCFTTLGDAVANAGPAPAQVFVFPGTYAESLELGTMGSALPGGNPGELAIVSVDAGGQPAPGAIIDPGAPSGPGSGDAISATAFPAPLTLDGLVVRSPDLNGIFLIGGTASARLVGVDASGSPMGNGAVVANSSGTIEVVDCTARLNFNAGFNLASQAGLVVVSGTLAERNDGAGFAIVAQSATITDSQSELNGDDGWVISPPSPGGSLTLTNVLSRGNAGQGLFSISINPDDQFAVVTATGLTLQNNGSQGATLFGFNVTLNQLTTEDNGGAGLNLGGETIAIQQLRSARNGDSGAFIGVTSQITIQGADIEGNMDGGLGVLAADGQTATASATDLVATGNVGTGIAFVGLQDARFAAVDIINATAVDNTEGGIAAIAHLATATQITVTDNISLGFILDATELAEASFVTSSGHTAGIVVDAEQEARLRDSDASNNISGLLVDGSRSVIERVTATMNGPSNGNPGSGA